MVDWLNWFYLGIFGAWVGTKVWETLCQWWQEGKQDLKIEEIESDASEWQAHREPYKEVRPS